MTDKEESDGSKYLREKSLEEEAKEALKTAAEEMGEPLSQQDYLNWRDEQAADKPTTSTLKRRIGDDGTDWSGICDICGIVGHNDNSHSEAVIETALQQAAEDMGQPLYISKYRAWRSKQDTDQPSTNGITHQNDRTWREACERVGISVGSKGGGKQRFSDTEVEYAVRQANDDTDGSLTWEKYESWVTNQSDSYPSPATVARRLGDGFWDQAKQNILQGANNGC